MTKDKRANVFDEFEIKKDYQALQELKASIEGCGFQCHPETYERAIKALEKQIPKHPIGLVKTSDDGYYHCPCCLGKIREINQKYVYNPPRCKCGQALEWDRIMIFLL